jgi:predicted ester cyclase
MSGHPKTEALIDLFVDDPPLKAHILATEGPFPLYRLDSEEIIAEGDLVAVRGRAAGVQQGEFMGMPPTGKSFDVLIFITYRVVGGKIVDHWMVFDNMTMLQQLGMLPHPAAA